jgi:cobalt/nickel transport protein
VRRRTFFITALVVALLVAGVGSYYASTHPDGLEYVAEQAGFQDQGKGGDALLEGGPAGVVGVLLVLLVMGGLAYAVRRRGPSQDEG